MAKQAFWFTFSDHAPACAWAEEAVAKELAAKVGTVVNVGILPYPARPRLDDDDNFGRDGFPSFCIYPTRCVGKTCCHNRPSCTD